MSPFPNWRWNRYSPPTPLPQTPWRGSASVSIRNGMPVRAGLIQRRWRTSGDLAAGEAGGVADRFDRAIVLASPALEHGRAGDEHVRAGRRDQRRRFRRDAAIDLDLDRPAGDHRAD